LKLPAAERTGKRIPENRDEFDGFQHRISHKQRPGINAYLAQRTDVVNAFAGIQKKQGMKLLTA
jgi:hypothetical protein